MNRAEKDIYIKESIPAEPGNNVFDGDTLAGVEQFDKAIAERERETTAKNEKAITDFEADLLAYDVMIVEEMKIKADAGRIKQLLHGRLRALQEFNNVADEFSDRYSKAVKLAEILINKVDGALLYLPDKINMLPVLTRSLSTTQQRYLFDELTNKGYIKTSFENFCQIFGGVPFENSFEQIKWESNNKQSLKNLLKELKPQNTSIAEIVRRADLYFMDRNSKRVSLPAKDRNHPNADEVIISTIIIGFPKE